MHFIDKSMKKNLFFLVIILTVYNRIFFATIDADETEVKLLSIVGCGRSGTTFITDYLNACGIQIEHEANGAEGCASWTSVVHLYSPFDQAQSQVRYRHTFHQVRHPLAVISSFYNNLNDTTAWYWRFIRDHTPEIHETDSLLVHCIKYWYYWNLKAEQIAEWRYQIENLENVLIEYQFRIGRPLGKDILQSIPKSINHWNSITYPITWKDVYLAIPFELYINIQLMAIRYGYSGR
jgi:hypothetical protein